MNNTGHESAGVGNRLLAAMSAADLDRVRPCLELVSLPARRVLPDASDAFEYVYFMNAGVVSLRAGVDGAAIDVGLVGNEGFVGVRAHAGDRPTTGGALVRVAGDALRIRASDLDALADNCAGLSSALRGYARALSALLSRTIACERAHETEERLCCLLLMLHDRVDGDHVLFTQEEIAGLLGARRARVNDAATRLKKRGALDYSRGRITIVDRSILESRCCPCYDSVRRELDRTIGVRARADEIKFAL